MFALKSEIANNESKKVNDDAMMQWNEQQQQQTNKLKLKIKLNRISFKLDWKLWIKR